MTVVTKNNSISKPPDPVKKLPPKSDLNSVENGDVDIEDMKRKINASTACVLLMMVVTMIGLLVYECMSGGTTTRRYTAFCTIPMEYKTAMEEMARKEAIKVLHGEFYSGSIRWVTPPYQEAQKIEDDDNATSYPDEAFREDFEVDPQVEKIKVYQNGRLTSFIHDFNQNFTGIIDDDRCFLMDLDTSVVLQPEMLMLAIEEGQDMDLSIVNTALRILTPALRDLSNRAKTMVYRCLDKPTYRLGLHDNTIHKRSTNGPALEYIQFAGKHVQEIEITNLAELLEHEKNHD